MRVHSAQHVSLRRGRGRSDPYSLFSWVDTLHGKCWPKCSQLQWASA